MLETGCCISFFCSCRSNFMSAEGGCETFAKDICTILFVVSFQHNKKYCGIAAS